MVNLFSVHLQDYTDHYFKPEVLIIKIKTRGCIKIKPLMVSLIQPLFEVITVAFLLSIDSKKAMLSRKNLTDVVHDNSPIPCQGTQDKQVHPP